MSGGGGSRVDDGDLGRRWTMRFGKPAPVVKLRWILDL
jgi:hypothetical protein